MKRFIALFLALCLALSVAAVIVAADTVQRVSANSVTVTAGNTAYVTLSAENFQNIAALDVYVYYDPTVMTVSSTSNGSLISGAQTSVNTAESGKITLSLMSLNGISGSGTLLTVRFAVKSDCEEGTYPVSIAIGRAYDGNLSEASVKGVNGSVTVNKPVVTEPFSLSAYLNNGTLQKGDVLTAYVVNYASRSFVSAEFTVEYDSDIFSFESVEFDKYITGEGAVYSVNSSIAGQVRIAYANDNPVDSYNLFSVNLKVIADKDGIATVKTSVSNVYRSDLSLYLPASVNNSVTLVKSPESVDYPNAFFVTDRLVVGKQSQTDFYLESGCNVAAADFTLNYDKTALRCVSVTAANGLQEKGGMVIVNDNFSNGVIRFSYINMDAYDDEDIVLVNIVWEVIKSPAKHYEITSSAVGAVDAQQNAIILEHVSDSNCIYVATVVEPTCKKEGSVNYKCYCGNTLETEILPVISEDECTHYTVKFVDWDGTEISSNEYHLGDKVDIPADPVRGEDENYTYTFAGWDKTVTDCAGDEIYNATYEEKIRYKLGDVNDDGKIDVYDYVFVKRHCLNTIVLTDTNALSADINGNGMIDIYDYVLIKRHCMGTYVIQG